MNKIKEIQYNVKKAQQKLNAIWNKNGRNMYWWIGRKNFGDLITEEMATKFNFTPVHCYPEKADFIGAGSLLQMLPTNFSGSILSTGIIEPRNIELPNAKFLSVRGELTKEVLGLDKELATGDLGLISNLLIQDNIFEKKYELGLIPHYVDKSAPWLNLVKEIYGKKCLIIDVEQTAKKVTEQIAKCNFVISSSLHGIIVADSLQVPCSWIGLSDSVVGNGFKFHDYASSIDSSIVKYAPSELDSVKKIEKSFDIKDYSIIKSKQREIAGLFQFALYN